jgi:hypothetical protein
MFDYVSHALSRDFPRLFWKAVEATGVVMAERESVLDDTKNGLMMPNSSYI